MTTVYDDLGDQDTGEVPMRRIRFTINGRKKVAEVEPRLLLSHLIRRGLGLTGTHMGCDTTNCGACTVLVDGKAIKSCTMLAVQADGHEITTVEGLATASELHPLQEGFKEEHGLQCGFCTPGMMLAAKALLDANPDPTEEDVLAGLDRYHTEQCDGVIGLGGGSPIDAAKAIRLLATHPPTGMRITLLEQRPALQPAVVVDPERSAAIDAELGRLHRMLGERLVELQRASLYN